MKAYKHRNRYGDIHTFTPTEDGNILWEGNFEYSRYGWTDSFDAINMVDPSGGPYITKGVDMKLFGFDGKIVNGFIPNEDGYEIVVNNL